MQLAAYLLIVNIISFLMFLLDKHLAILHEWRIPERALLLTTILGGSVGALLGMYIARHKTKKPLFYLGVPFILALHAGIAAIWLRAIS